VSFRDQQVFLRNSTQPDVSLTFSLDQWRDLMATLKVDWRQR
jgi:hypothetical protein